MPLETETKVALIGLCLTAVFSTVGLFLNFLALRQSNRLAISSKLVEASKILSDELVSVSRAKLLLSSELAESEKHPDSPERARKIATLFKLIEEINQRQKQIDQNHKEISKLFADYRRVSPAQVDELITISYSRQAYAESSHDLMQELKAKNA